MQVILLDLQRADADRSGGQGVCMITYPQLPRLVRGRAGPWS
jgi:hypothetical protein